MNQLKKNIARTVFAAVLGSGAACYFSRHHDEEDSAARHSSITALRATLNAYWQFHQWRTQTHFPQYTSEQLERMKRIAENQQQYKALVDKLERLLAEKEPEIERLAERIYREHRCRVEINDGYGEKMSREDLLQRINVSVEQIEDRFQDQMPIDRTVDLTYGHNLFTVKDMIHDLQTIDLNQDHPSFRSSAAALAQARSYERCLDESGVVDMVRDYHREKNEGNCDQALNLAQVLHDQYQRLKTIRDCQPLAEKDAASSDAGTRDAARKEAFFSELETLSDPDLLQAADRHLLGTYPDDRQRWLKICSEKRINYNLSAAQAKASCIADMGIQDVGWEGGMEIAQNLNISQEEIAQLIDNLPNDRQRHERECYLKAPGEEEEHYRHRDQTPDGFFISAEYVFDQCMGRAR